MNDRRLLVVTNPNSTKSHKVQREVINPLHENGDDFTIVQTQTPDTEENIAHLRTKIRDGDRVISAAGDGTAMQVVNAVLREGVDAELGFLPYGNFNDLARVHGLRNPLDAYSDVTTTELHPLTVDVNGQYMRDAPAYVSLGWSAIAASHFGQSGSRDKLRRYTRLASIIPSMGQLARDYFALRNEKLPPFHASHNLAVRDAVTDVLAVNSPRVGAVVRSERDYYDSNFYGYDEVNVSHILPNFLFGLQALIGRLPAELRTTASITFENPSTVPFQSEGEFLRLEDVSTIDIYKDPSKSVSVIHK